MDTSPEVKAGIKIVGWDDGPFRLDKNETVPVVGAVTRGGDYLEGLEKTGIEVDGLDATSRIIEAIESSKHYEQLEVQMLDGITFGGFNVVDIEKLSEKTGIPSIAITKRKPDFEALRKALKNLPRWESRWRLIKKAGKPRKVSKSSIYFQAAGIDPNRAEKLVKISSTRSKVPEPLRLADIISSIID